MSIELRWVYKNIVVSDFGDGNKTYKEVKTLQYRERNPGCWYPKWRDVPTVVILEPGETE